MNDLETIIKIEPEAFSCVSVDEKVEKQNTGSCTISESKKICSGKTQSDVEDDDMEIEILPNPYEEQSFPSVGDKDYFKEFNTNDEVDWNLMNSVRIVHEYLSLNEPVHGLTEDEWLEKLKNSCDFNRTQLSPKVLRLSWQEIVRLTAEQLPATRQCYPYRWLGDHLFVQRKEMRIWTIAGTDRIHLAELLFVACLRGRELQDKSKAELLWPRCGDLRCASPMHLMIVTQAELKSRVKCCASKATCLHDPACIVNDPLPPMTNEAAELKGVRAENKRRRKTEVQIVHKMRR